MNLSFLFEQLDDFHETSYEYHNARDCLGFTNFEQLRSCALTFCATKNMERVSSVGIETGLSTR